ncbi:MAG TPA: TerC family protein [Burkholderiales bacterium]|nr:TerC family protein [Burkholderiales bacterium]
MRGIELLSSLFEIIGVNIVLSGDNAVVIALASRALPREQRGTAIALGSAGAILMRIALTVAAAELLRLPWLRLAGALLLLWIGVRMLLDGGDDHDLVAAPASGPWAAIRTILVADFVMSLDNILGVAAAARGQMTLLMAGLIISIPLIVFGSALILRVMDRFPVLVTLGAGLIGYVAGEMLLDEPVVESWLPTSAAFVSYGVPVASAVVVILAGHAIAARGARSRGRQVIDPNESDQSRPRR